MLRRIHDDTLHTTCNVLFVPSPLRWEPIAPVESARVGVHTCKRMTDGLHPQRILTTGGQLHRAGKWPPRPRAVAQHAWGRRPPTSLGFGRTSLRPAPFDMVATGPGLNRDLRVRLRGGTRSQSHRWSPQSELCEADSRPCSADPPQPFFSAPRLGRLNLPKAGPLTHARQRESLVHETPTRGHLGNDAGRLSAIDCLRCRRTSFGAASMGAAI